MNVILPPWYNYYREAMKMMGCQDGQLKLVVADLGALIPENHLLRKIDEMVSFSFIYDLMAPHYSNLGHRSIDPVCMVKMLLVGYLYGIGSERRLVQEIQLNIAYRWFCGFGIDDAIPEHSIFSQTRRRRWSNSNLFEQIFLRIVKACIETDLVDGETMVADGSFIPSNVSRSSWTEVERSVTKTMHSYLDVLDDELASQPGFKKTAGKSCYTKTAHQHHQSRQWVYLPAKQKRDWIFA